MERREEDLTLPVYFSMLVIRLVVRRESLSTRSRSEFLSPPPPRAAPRIMIRKAKTTPPIRSFFIRGERPSLPRKPEVAGLFGRASEAIFSRYSLLSISSL